MKKFLKYSFYALLWLWSIVISVALLSDAPKQADGRINWGACVVIVIFLLLLPWAVALFVQRYIRRKTEANAQQSSAVETVASTSPAVTEMDTETFTAFKNMAALVLADDVVEKHEAEMLYTFLKSTSANEDVRTKPLFYVLRQIGENIEPFSPETAEELRVMLGEFIDAQPTKTSAPKNHTINSTQSTVNSDASSTENSADIYRDNKKAQPKETIFGIIVLLLLIGGVVLWYEDILPWWGALLFILITWVIIVAVFFPDELIDKTKNTSQTNATSIDDVISISITDDFDKEYHRENYRGREYYETLLGELVIGNRYEIDYIDYNKNFSNRIIRLQKIMKNARGDTILRAYCEWRKENRSFKLRNIESMIDVETGEVLK